MLSPASQLHFTKHFSRAFHFNSVLQFKQTTIEDKRARMLTKLIQNKDKKKNWHLQMGATGAPNENIYNKVHRPHRRASVLNSLFMKNITDVLSTGDVCPEIMGHGIEITGVRVTSDYRILNVFWQIPNAEETANTNVEMVLAKGAPDIRGELVRRNVLGKVPRIYFIRDPTNKRVADFQKCLEDSGVSEIKNPSTVPVGDFIKNLYKFSEARDGDKNKTPVEPEKPKVPAPGPESVPERPPNMKFDVMGLNHDFIFNKVLAAKKKVNVTPQTSCAVQPVAEGEGGSQKSTIVYSIPATPLRDDVDWEKQMKKFYIERKAQWAKTVKPTHEETSFSHKVPVDVDGDEIDDDSFEDDYDDDFEEYEEYKDMDDRHS